MWRSHASYLLHSISRCCCGLVEVYWIDQSHASDWSMWNLILLIYGYAKMLKYCAVWFYDQSFLNGFAYAEIKRNQRFLLPSFWVCYCLTDFVHTKTVTHLGFDDKRWTFVSPIATDHPRTNQSVRAKTPSLLENFIKVLQINILCIKMQLNSLRFGSAL